MLHRSSEVSFDRQISRATGRTANNPFNTIRIERAFLNDPKELRPVGHDTDGLSNREPLG